MPIECSFEPRSIDHGTYKNIDYTVTGHIFDAHKLLGRLHDEDVYQAELLRACRAAGLTALVEAPIKVTFENFSKTYFLDLVIENAIDYELKTVDALTSRHKAQLVNYLMLSGLTFGRLANFRPPSVQLRHTRTGVEREDRYSIHIEKDRFTTVTNRCTSLPELIGEILRDWGAFLELSLYFDVVSHVLGGEDGLIETITVTHNAHELGTVKATLLDSKTALELTAFRHCVDGYASQLTRKYRHTEIEHVQWINFEGQIISFRTLTL